MKKLEDYSEFEKKYLDEYCTGVFSDELDKLGFRSQVVNQWSCNSPGERLFGKVRTLELEEIETDDERIDVGLGFLGNLTSGEVMIVKGSHDFAYFGELMTRLSVEVGINGVVIDGLTRDTFYTHKQNFPIFAKGYTPKDIKGRGRVKECDVVLNVQGVEVKSGDYVFADNDAVVFIPEDIYPKLMIEVNKAVEEEFEIKEKIASGVSIKDILLNHKSF